MRVKVVAGVSGGKATMTVQGTCAHAPVCVSKCVLEQPPTSIAAGVATLSNILCSQNLTCWLWLF